jgi:putative ABC transport system ATP-binding protein
VAEQGTYKELSSNPNGAFSKLMEWQLSGGEDKRAYEPEGMLTEAEEIAGDLIEQSGDNAGESSLEKPVSKPKSPVQPNRRS